MPRPIRFRAAPRQTPRNQPNRLEQAFLEYIRGQPGVATVRFNAITLVLANNVRFTPDVWVVMDNGDAVFYEIKGFMRDDARIKLQVAAQQYPEFQFVLVTRPRLRDPWVFSKCEVRE